MFKYRYTLLYKDRLELPGFLHAILYINELDLATALNRMQDVFPHSPHQFEKSNSKLPLKILPAGTIFLILCGPNSAAG